MKVKDNNLVNDLLQKPSFKAINTLVVQEAKKEEVYNVAIKKFLAEEKKEQASKKTLKERILENPIGKFFFNPFGYSDIQIS